jgi:hypothetical protein
VSWCASPSGRKGIMRERIVSLLGLTSSLTTLIC